MLRRLLVTNPKQNRKQNKKKATVLVEKLKVLRVGRIRIYNFRVSTPNMKNETGLGKSATLFNAILHTVHAHIFCSHISYVDEIKSLLIFEKNLKMYSESSPTPN